MTYCLSCETHTNNMASRSVNTENKVNKEIQKIKMQKW